MKKKIYQYKRFWLLLLVVTYLLVGFFYVPKIIGQQLKQQMAQQLSMQAEISKVKFNPLTFNTELHQLRLTDTNQEQWFSTKSAAINFDPLNLLWGQWQFSDLILDQPNVTLLTDTAGQVLIPAIPDFPTTEESGETLDFNIDDIQLNQGRMNLQAGNIKKDFALNIKSIEVSHDKFSLADEDSHFKIKITTENDESIALNGQYNHNQQLIKTAIELTDWQATTLNQILPDHLGVNNQSGLIQATGQIDWLISINPKINFSTIHVSNLATNWQDKVQLNDLNAQINDAVIDSETQAIQVKSITSDQANWAVNWPIDMTEDPGSEPTATSEIDSKSPEWQVVIDHTMLQNWPVQFNDTTIQNKLPFVIDALEIKAINNLSEPFTVSSELNLSQQGSVQVNSEIGLSPLSLEAALDLSQIGLNQLAPWITEQSGLVFSQGTLTSTQNIKIQQGDFELNGDLSISNAIILNQSDQDIADFGQLIIGATNITSQNKTIVVNQITIDQANGNIIIDADKNINIQNLKTQDESSPIEQPKTESTESNDWVIKVGAINIKDTSTSLIDQSVNPTVSTQVTELNGQIKGLSSESLSKADVDINGKFNQFSPLSIRGKINPLSSDAYTDLKVVIEDLDLLAFSPYSASYAAFPINGGKLNLELDYSLNQHELIGKNNMLFKQLKFGDKTDAPDAVQLPLKLAVSLLSDGNGEMKIDLPVAGNIDDPEFSYGGIIGKALFKLITGIVASPFKLLGKLIPNPDPNLSDIQFNAGSADLIESEKNKLNQIAEIMVKKTELNLQLNPHVNNGFDEPVLKQISLLEKAPFTAFDATNDEVIQWLESQVSPEVLLTYANETSYDHDKMWQDMIQQQVINPEQLQALTDARNLNIKNYLLESAGIAAEKVFIEQAQSTENSQAMIKIGVSR